MGGLGAGGVENQGRYKNKLERSLPQLIINFALPRLTALVYLRMCY